MKISVKHTQGSETMGGRACIRAQFPHRADRQQTEEVQKHMGVMPPPIHFRVDDNCMSLTQR